MTASADDELWRRLAEAASSALGGPFRKPRVTRLRGDGLAAAWRVEDVTGQAVMVKIGPADCAGDLSAESDGLAALAETRTVRVPGVLAQGETSGHAWLMLEFLHLGSLQGASAARFGATLANLHRATGEQFGWHRDNLLGRSRQANTPTGDWLSFWREQRLGPQLSALARVPGTSALRATCGAVMAILDELLGKHRPAASLLHGDLWSGNLAQDEDGLPVVFDPAVYRGDREVDLAMTSLFGGVPRELEQAYRAAWPLPAGHQRRRCLYNLHHALNHLLLFGRGWQPLAMRLAEGALSTGEQG